MSEIFKIRIVQDATWEGREYRAGMVGYADARTAMRLVNAGIAEYIRQEEMHFDDPTEEGDTR